MNKIYEFIENKDVLMKELEDIIYFDEKWMIPGDNIYDFISRRSKITIPDDFKKLASDVVYELNNKKIHPHKFLSGYNSIIKKLTIL